MANPIDAVVGRVKKLMTGYSKLKEAKQISKHFSDYLRPVVADSPDSKTKVFNIRHQVYCEELNFEPIRDDEQESDDFDDFSIHAMIQHLQTGNFAGTVRIVHPDDDSKQLPIEKYCLHSITDEELSPANFARHEICEISRLAVPARFRRRKIDQFEGAATGVINPQTYSEEELRCFPFIAIGLYMSAASIVIAKGIPHTYVMMEPRLARSMSFLGIKFHKLGPTVEYHGQRAPYYINPSLLMKNLTPAFKTMLKDIQHSIAEQKHLFSQ
ncbi:PEP-CTERM/exosortase system-associated acyltransferase [Alteromonas sp. ASW11-36]|uniref:PEP-CTERM/exosortase system-associated acyltransferase n=1 Tax=Alteromonas arenosi TaxID=3055817 RepID=A0ABT7STZ3_9ALTE|nr:PEP-CTERM/exosortase system-associated acyltransferase [Alteromonas sp. ASW11-36]MDM7859651.1 PEP-CTERM/exosortase system-associated acyltransferase [Alteromonas sp. ASW11-36]